MSKRSTDTLLEVPGGLILIDSCILIDSLRGYEPAISWLRSGTSRYDVTLSISVVTIVEILAGAKSEKTYSGAGWLFSQMRSIPIDEGIAERAGRYLRQWRQSHGLQMADALIAATAAELGATLITRDSAHFPMDDVIARAPYR